MAVDGPAGVDTFVWHARPVDLQLEPAAILVAHTEMRTFKDIIQLLPVLLPCYLGQRSAQILQEKAASSPDPRAEITA